MRITQAYVPSPLHASGFHDKFKLDKYHNVDDPACFFGAHLSILNIIRGHRGHRTLIWIGMDAYNMSIGKHDVELVKQCRNISTSRSIERVLNGSGIDNEYWPISCFTFEGIKPAPLGDKIYFYHGREDLYQCDLMRRIEKRIDHDVIWVNGWGVNSREQTFELYKQCFCGVRLREIDGLSNTGIELGLMGRMVIHNGDVPNNMGYLDEDDIVNKINFLARKGVDPVGISKAVRNFIDIGYEWLYVEEEGA